MRSTPRELLRRPKSDELGQLRRVLAHGGRADQRCTCGTGAAETRVHWRLHCPLAKEQTAGIARAANERLAVQGCSFWFDVPRRVGDWHATDADKTRVLERAGLVDEDYDNIDDAGGRRRLYGHEGTAAEQQRQTTAVVTRERLACWAALWQVV